MRGPVSDGNSTRVSWLAASLLLNVILVVLVGAMSFVFFERASVAPRDDVTAPADLDASVEESVEESPGDDRRGASARLPRTRTIDAVEWGLQWLANHQSADGSWDSDGFEAQCKTSICDGKGHPLYDRGLTGLALLAFLGAGYTHNFGKYKENVRYGLRYLMSVQEPEGCFGSRTAHDFTYGHAICTLAMTEAYGLTQFALFKGPAQKGLEFISECRNPGAAWRYGVQPGDNDSSVTGWMVMALKSGESAGLQVNPEAYRGAREFLDSVTDETGKVGYTQRGNGPVRPERRLEAFPARYSEALTAIGLWSRVLLKDDPGTSERSRKGVALVLSKLPVWEPNKLDFYYWYFGTLAMYQVGGEHFEQWNDALLEAVVETQESEGEARGSWRPLDAWGEEGGRVYSTALLTMCLEVSHRR